MSDRGEHENLTSAREFLNTKARIFGEDVISDREEDEDDEESDDQIEEDDNEGDESMTES